MEYWKAFKNLETLMRNDFWKGDHVPPSTSAQPWLEYIYIAKIIPDDTKIKILKYKTKNDEELDPSPYFKIGFSNNDSNNVELSRRLKELDSEYGKVRLLYRWRLPSAQKYESSIKEFLINFRFKEKEIGCIQKIEKPRATNAEQNEQKTQTNNPPKNNPPKGFTEIIYNIPITTLVHTIQLCIIYHSLKNYLTDKTNSGALSDMTVSPTSIQDESDEYEFRSTEEPKIVFNYTDVFDEINNKGIYFSIYPQRCLDWNESGKPLGPDRFKDYIMNYRTDFDDTYDFRGGGDGGLDDDGGDPGGAVAGGGGGGGGEGKTPEGKTGNLLPLVLYALRF